MSFLYEELAEPHAFDLFPELEALVRNESARLPVPKPTPLASSPTYSPRAHLTIRDIASLTTTTPAREPEPPISAPVHADTIAQSEPVISAPVPADTSAQQAPSSAVALVECQTGGIEKSVRCKHCAHGLFCIVRGPAACVGCGGVKPLAMQCAACRRFTCPTCLVPQSWRVVAGQQVPQPQPKPPVQSARGALFAAQCMDMRCAACSAQFQVRYAPRHWATARHHERIRACDLLARHCSLRCKRERPLPWVTIFEHHTEQRRRGLVQQRSGCCGECGGLVLPTPSTH